MELFSTSWQVITTILVFLAGMVVANVLGRSFQTDPRRAMLLYVWHTIFCVIFTLYVIKNGGDATYYYADSQQGDVKFSLGTESVVFITALFSYILGLSFLGTSFAFNILGFIGLLAFDASLRCATEGKSITMRRIATLIVFLPSVSFWSAAIGKDSLSFMATGLALWAALNLRRRTRLMVLAVLIMLLVRPHIAGMIVIALTGSMLLQRKVHLGRRLALGGAALAACAVMVPVALRYAGLEANPNSNDVASYIEQRQQYNQEGGGGIDISSMSLPMQLVTYLFRPLPFEASSIFSLAGSIDNLVLLFLFLAGSWQILKRRKQVATANRTFLWLYSLFVWIILAVNTANLGISMRQKWMFTPMLIFLFITAMGKPRRAAQRNRHAVSYRIVSQAPRSLTPPFTKP